MRISSLTLLIFFSSLVGTAGADEAPPRRVPLPLSLAAHLRTHDMRSPINFSPDGVWLAHTVELAETVPGTAARGYTPTGVPLGEGMQIREATLSNPRTGEQIVLGDRHSSSWGPVWSPDGRRVAYYSDSGGKAGLWIWERASSRTWRFPGLVARSYFGFELPNWASDSQRLLCKVLPEGRTLVEANALVKVAVDAKNGLNASQPVLVRSSTVTPASSAPTHALKGDVQWIRADLALLDCRTQRAVRLVRDRPVRFYAFSRDSRSVAYAIIKGWEANTQTPEFDLFCMELAHPNGRRVVENLPMQYGTEWSWSPDGRRLAALYGSHGKIAVMTVATGARVEMGDDHTPSFDPGDGEVCPVWCRDGKAVLAIGGDSLWRLQADTGAAQKLVSSPDWHFRTLVANWFKPWLNSDTAWILGRQVVGAKRALLSVDLRTGVIQPHDAQNRGIYGVFNLAICPQTGELAYVATDQQLPGDLFVYAPDQHKDRRASHLNPALEKIELGQARVIDWTTASGKALHGALLLPPGRKEGQRLPLVVWVYGGNLGSEAVNRFGFWGEMAAFDFHVLATRGYAVLYPDAPLRTGQRMADLLQDVMPGVDAAIAQGYADPDRLAVMGQSYGSYCTLSLMVQTTRFKAAITTGNVGHPDLVAAYLEGNTGYYEHGQGGMGGTPWNQRERYLANSPIYLFDKITTPLLMGQGDQDGKLFASEAIFNALDRLHKSVEYRLYRNEGHVISQPSNVIDFWRRRLEFLAEHLHLQVDPDGSVLPKA
jgi:dipeptidyl aminopeptidase/acylaminoacyl peptidase